MQRKTLIVALALCLPALAQSSHAQIVYPDARRVDHVDTYHGTQVHDPYRWLENSAREDAEVATWVEAQNDVTFDYLANIPERDRIRERLTELWNYEKISAPFEEGGRYFMSRNSGLQNQSVLYTMDSLDDEPRELLDPNTLREDGTVALTGVAVSPDGEYLAYGLAEAGSDWQTWHVRDVETGADLADVVRWVKFSEASWTKDGQGFFYSRYDAPKEGDAFQNVNQFQKLYYHRLGTSQDEDVLVYHRPDEPDWGFDGAVTDDGRYLVITIWQGTDNRYRVMYKDLDDPDGEPVDLIPTFESDYTFIGNDGSEFLFRTDKDAPLGRVIAIDIREPDAEHWREVVPESRDTLTGVNFVGHTLIANYLEDAKSAVRVYDTAGEFLRRVDLPGIGSVSGFDGDVDDLETFYTFSSFTTPPAIYRYDVRTGQSTLLRETDVAFNPDDYMVNQAFYKSKDGTRVPLFIVHRKDIELNGRNPTLLYGYGGFNISLTPGFSVSRLAWIEMGGVFAVANLRGGGEYGEAWHKAGTKLDKQNVFDDFIAAAKWLMTAGYTQPRKLAIQGGSNGGLLVGACMTQEPNLFGACLPAVGVMDMLRFHKFTIGWAWTDDYGSSDDPEQFEALHAYSPYHSIRPGTTYPPTLITTADTDDRVVPGHSFKFAAALQYAQAGVSPTLIRIETRAGHGAGKPTEKRIEEIADQWAFLVHNLDVELD